MSEANKKIPRPPARLIFSTPEHLFAFGFGSGLAPFAPGTFGTLVGLPVFLLMSWLPVTAYFIVVLGLFGFGCWVCGRSARLLGVHDYGGIVFDEIVGLLITCVPLLFVPAEARVGALWQWLLLAFLVFRVFDILKPWPINVFDRSLGGGFGIMIDDALAGVYGAVVLAIALQVSRNW